MFKINFLLQNKAKNFLLCILLLAISHFVIILGCNKTGKNTKETSITLTIWETYGEQERKVFNQIVADYQKLRPDVKISVQPIPWGGHQEKLLTAAVTRTTPDIARVECGSVSRFARRNALVNLEEFGALELKEKILPAAFGSVIYEGHIYGIPDQITGVCLVYNKDMFKSAGIDTNYCPETWEDFIELAKKFTNPKKGIYGFGMDLGLWWTFPFFNTFGAKFISDDLDSCLLNSPEGIAALQLKVDLYQKHKIEGGAWITGGKGAREGFTNNIYAMIFTGPWDIEQLKKENKHFGVCLIPKGPKGTSTNVGGTDMVVFKTSKHPKEAFEFLKYLSSAEVQVKWSNSLGQIPVNIDAYGKIDSLKYPELKVYMEQMKTAVPRPQIASYEDIETIINPELEAALTGQKTVKDALDSAVRKINKKLAEDKDPLY